MANYLSVDDGLKRSLGYLDDDDLLDDASITRLQSNLVAAENFVQRAVGDADESFYKSDDVFDLYKLACFAIAGNWFTHPSSANSSTTAKQIIGQLRARYDEVIINGSTSGSEPAEYGN